jgi:hypothetical protein
MTPKKKAQGFPCAFAVRSACRQCLSAGHTLHCYRVPGQIEFSPRTLEILNRVMPGTLWAIHAALIYRLFL